MRPWRSTARRRPRCRRRPGRTRRRRARRRRRRRRRSSSTTASRARPSMSLSHRTAPSAAMRRATARPMPFPPPLISTTSSCIRPLMVLPRVRARRRPARQVRNRHARCRRRARSDLDPPRRRRSGRCPRAGRRRRRRRGRPGPWAWARPRPRSSGSCTGRCAVRPASSQLATPGSRWETTRRTRSSASTVELRLVERALPLGDVDQLEPGHLVELEAPVAGPGAGHLHEQGVVGAEVPEAEAVAGRVEALGQPEGGGEACWRGARPGGRAGRGSSSRGRPRRPGRPRRGAGPRLGARGAPGRFVGVGVEALDGEGGRLGLAPVEVVLADRHAQRALGERDRAALADQEVDLVAGAEAEVGGGDLEERAPRLEVHEARPDGEHELVAGVHVAPDAVAAAALDPGVAVDVVGVGPAPLGDEVVLALEGRTSGVGVEHRPAEPAQGLLGHVGDAVGAVLVGGGEVVAGEAAPDARRGGRTPRARPRPRPLSRPPWAATLPVGSGRAG